jgi:hypothetical protein
VPAAPDVRAILPLAPQGEAPVAPPGPGVLSAEPEAAATASELATLDPELCLALPEELPMIAQMKQALLTTDPAPSRGLAAALAAPRSEQLDVTGDLRFLRFLRSRSHDVPLAVEAMRGMLQWRADNDIDATIRPGCVSIHK